MRLIAQFGLFNGILALLLIVIYSFGRNNNKIYLGLSLFFVWYTLLLVILTITRQILNYPVLHRTGLITAYLAFPFLFVYSRNSFYPGKAWRKQDWLLLIPALVYLIDYLPYFLLPVDQKLSILQQNLSSDERIFLAGEGWLGLTGVYFPFAYIWVAIIMYFQARLIIVNRKRNPGFNTPHNRKLFNFIIAITVLYLPLVVPGIFGVLLRSTWFNPEFVGLTYGLSLSAISILLFISPHILYGFIPEKRFSNGSISQVVKPVSSDNPSQPHIIVEEPVAINISKKEVRKTGSSTADDEDELAAEAEIVLQQMNTAKPFLKQGFTIQDLSNQTGIPVYQLSPLINNRFKMNFANWVNSFRIEYLIREVMENPHLTLEALSQKAGFISRSTFINAFKKAKGTTPREYFKELKLPA